MKKRKTNILLQIATLCLCIAAIAFGVYSAKTASLNVSGSVGFNAHNCNVKITSTLLCKSSGESGATDSTTVKSIELNANSESGEGTNNIVTKNSTYSNYNLGTLQFNDLVEGGNVVKVLFKIENFSKFPIDVTTAVPTIKKGDNTISSISVTYKDALNNHIDSAIKLTAADSTDNSSTLVSYGDDWTTLTLTLTIADIDSVSEDTIKDATINLSFSFNKIVVNNDNEKFIMINETDNTRINGYKVNVDGTTSDPDFTIETTESKFFDSLPNNLNRAGENYLSALCDGFNEALTELIENEGLADLENKQYDNYILYTELMPSGLTVDNVSDYILEIRTSSEYQNQTVLAVIGIPESANDNTNIKYYAFVTQDPVNASFNLSIAISIDTISTLLEKNCEEFFILLFAYDN